MILQKITFPVDHICPEPQMYFHGVDDEQITETEVRVKKGQTLYLDTYFNSFSLGKWMKYTQIKDLKLTLDIDGEYDIRFYQLNGAQVIKANPGDNTKAVYRYGRGKITNLSCDFASDYMPVSEIGVGDAVENVICPVIRAKTDLVLRGGAYETSDEAVNDVKFALCICTFKREEALKYNEVESVLEDGEQEDIFSPEYYEKLSDVKMPASKLELLVKMLRKQIKEYAKTNQMAAKKFHEMLEATINEYHERRKHLSAEEAGEAQEMTSEEIIKNATEQALKILKDMNADRESFRKIGLTFEEKAFYDILMALRDQYNFEYGEDKVIDGVLVNDKCRSLAKKIKEIIDTKSSFADWLNNQIVRDQLKFDIKVCLVKNGYPPQYSPEVFRKVMEQVENFEENT